MDRRVKRPSNSAELASFKGEHAGQVADGEGARFVIGAAPYASPLQEDELDLLTLLISFVSLKKGLFDGLSHFSLSLLSACVGKKKKIHPEKRSVEKK